MYAHVHINKATRECDFSTVSIVKTEEKKNPESNIQYIFLRVRHKVLRIRSVVSVVFILPLGDVILVCVVVRQPTQ
jgi:hypothetical protein